MSSLFVLGGVGVAILLESLASPSSPAPRPKTAHRSDPSLRALALAASLLLLGATVWAAIRTSGVFMPLCAAGLVVLGGWLRAAAMRNLGSQFRTEADADELVTAGIHGVMRHPSELGLICWTLGLFTAAPSLTAGVLAAAQLPLLLVRVRMEETALADRFAEQWQRYASQTPRLGV
ncbi:MAG: hypothetical protein KUG77_15760 [Nannocystaceae bacterium]|nr:hypothetical protein [Nannocystaceae bacterium]